MRKIKEGDKMSNKTKKIISIAWLSFVVITLVSLGIIFATKYMITIIISLAIGALIYSIVWAICQIIE